MAVGGFIRQSCSATYGPPALRQPDSSVSAALLRETNEYFCTRRACAVLLFSDADDSGGGRLRFIESVAESSIYEVPRTVPRQREKALENERSHFLASIQTVKVLRGKNVTELSVILIKQATCHLLVCMRKEDRVCLRVDEYFVPWPLRSLRNSSIFGFQSIVKGVRTDTFDVMDTLPPG